jgi:hypothetical protein
MKTLLRIAIPTAVAFAAALWIGLAHAEESVVPGNSIQNKQIQDVVTACVRSATISVLSSLLLHSADILFAGGAFESILTAVDDIDLHNAAVGCVAGMGGQMVVNAIKN